MQQALSLRRQTPRVCCLPAGKASCFWEHTVRSTRAAVIPVSIIATSVSTSRHDGPSVAMTAQHLEVSSLSFRNNAF